MFLDSSRKIQAPVHTASPGVSGTPEIINTSFGAATVEQIMPGFWTAKIGNLARTGKTAAAAIEALEKAERCEMQISRENF